MGRVRSSPAPQPIGTHPEAEEQSFAHVLTPSSRRLSKHLATKEGMARLVGSDGGMERREVIG